MKTLGLSLCAVVGMICLFGCKFMLEQPGPSQPTAATPKLEGPIETLTGKVVMAEGAYRFQPLKEPDSLFRLTRGKRKSDFEREQINLRKYYEKTISVKGTREDGWIWRAAVTGQWLQPGEPTGPNMKAPPVPNR